VGRRSGRALTAVVCVGLTIALAICAAICANAVADRRELRVALYPFIPEFVAAAEGIKRDFEAAHPHISLDILDLRSNYYAPDEPNYIETVDADVFEVDSVLLAQFIADKKIRELPTDMLLPPAALLTNAYVGTQVNGKRYGAAHWVCRNLLFFPAAKAPQFPIRTLADLERFVGSADATDRLLVDLKGKLTLGEFYLSAAFDHYSDTGRALAAAESMDSALADDITRLLKLCPPGGCRDEAAHDDPRLYATVFARHDAKALIGYSELLHDVLAARQACGDACLSDSDLAVSDLALDDSGSTPIAWVDSFAVNAHCTAQCLADAASFVRFMNQDSTYLKLLLPLGPSALSGSPAPVVPSYLLPAKAALYSNPALLQHAHLYPELKALVENATVPTAEQLNSKLRLLGSQLDHTLDDVAP
jgi:thiamine pyridinylase